MAFSIKKKKKKSALQDIQFFFTQSHVTNMLHTSIWYTCQELAQSGSYDSVSFRSLTNNVVHKLLGRVIGWVTCHHLIIHSGSLKLDAQLSLHQEVYLEFVSLNFFLHNLCAVWFHSGSHVIVLLARQSWTT